MLPDWPNLKKDLLDFVTAYVRMRVRQLMPVTRDMPTVIFFEGHEKLSIRDDGSEDRSCPSTAESTIELEGDEVTRLTLEELFTKMNRMAEEIARQQSRQIFERIDEAIESVGNVRSMSGKPLRGSDVLDMLEMVQIDFDERLDPIMPTAVGHPRGQEAFAKAMSEIEDDFELKARREAIIARKREEYRDREAARNLVG